MRRKPTLNITPERLKEIKSGEDMATPDEIREMGRFLLSLFPVGFRYPSWARDPAKRGPYADG